MSIKLPFSSINFLACFIILNSTISASESSSRNCDKLSKQFGVPCLSVPYCTAGAVTTSIDNLSNGQSKSKSKSVLDICYNDDGIVVVHNAQDQTYYATNSYDCCNDAIYNLNVAEMFIAPYIEREAAPHCYSEIDISPKNVMFESGVYNPNLNHSGISNYLMNCTETGISNEVNNLSGFLNFLLPI